MKKNQRKRNHLKKSSGFTLIEMLVALSILSLITMFFVSLLSDSIKIFGANSKGYEIQSDVVYTSNMMNEVVRDSTAIFILAKDKYDPDKMMEEKIQNNITALGLKNEWSYIGQNSDRTKIYNFIWDKEKGKHIPMELTISEKKGFERNTLYKMNISREQDNIRKKIQKYRNIPSLTQEQKDELKKLQDHFESHKRVLRYSIEGTFQDPNLSAGSSDGLTIRQDRQKTYTAEATVQAINVKQIFDQSKGSEATAIAYRKDPINPNKVKKEKIAVAVVLDFSRSMKNDLDGAAMIRTLNGVERRIMVVEPSHEVRMDNKGIYKTYGVYETYRYDKANDKKYLAYDMPLPGESMDNVTKYYVAYDDLKKEVYYTTEDQSFKFYVDESTITPKERRRVTILNNEFAKLINNLANIGPVPVYVVPFEADGFFSYYGDQRKNFTDTLNRMDGGKKPYMISKESNSDNAELINTVASFIPSGTTNYGGGVREALKLLKNSGVSKTYLLVLSDGYPTEYNYEEVIGKIKGYSPNNPECLKYVDRVIQNSTHTPSVVHIVGFSNVEQDNKNLEEIKGFFEKKGINSVEMYKAGTAEQLEDAFENFYLEIDKDLWYFEGP